MYGSGSVGEGSTTAFGNTDVCGEAEMLGTTSSFGHKTVNIKEALDY